MGGLMESMPGPRCVAFGRGTGDFKTRWIGRGTRGARSCSPSQMWRLVPSEAMTIDVGMIPMLALSPMASGLLRVASRMTCCPTCCCPRRQRRPPRSPDCEDPSDHSGHRSSPVLLHSSDK
eukprot:scaffold1199_cov265-Pinguiococcus_pyrenoidosus.AAC.26